MDHRRPAVLPIKKIVPHGAGLFFIAVIFSS